MGDVDTAEHTLSECGVWDRERDALRLALGMGGDDELTLRGAVAAIVRAKECWTTFSFYCGTVMRFKEAHERWRQAEEGPQ